MTAAARKTGKTETLYILTYLADEIPPITLYFATQRKTLVCTHYHVSQDSIAADVTAEELVALTTAAQMSETVTAVFFMKSTSFSFEVHIERSDETAQTVYLALPQFFCKAQVKQCNADRIEFRLGEFCAYAEFSPQYPPSITLPQEFQELANSRCREWLQSDGASHEVSDVYTARGTLLLLQPKVVAAGFTVSHTDAHVMVPQVGDKGTATLVVAGRVCPADIACLKITSRKERLFALFSIQFIHPEDIRFFYESFFHATCPDSMIPHR